MMDDPDSFIPPFAAGSDGMRHWDAASTHPEDFTSWSYALQSADTHDNITSFRTVYDAFLAHYPLCYVYWQKYAERESKEPTTAEGEDTSHSRAVAVYERAVNAISSCVDLWLHYIGFLSSSYDEESSEHSSALKRVLARSIDSPAGLDPRAGLLYEKYIELAAKEGDQDLVSRLYRRVISLPVDGLDSFHEKWNAIERTPEEKSSAEEAFALAKAELEGRQPFEGIIKQRTYFHYKAVDLRLLNAWHDLINHLMHSPHSDGGSSNATIAVFERCLVVCANYLSFYKRYAYYLEAHDNDDAAREVWEAAVQRTGKFRPCALLSLALFEESHGNIEKSREAYAEARKLFPNHLETLVRNAQFEGRKRGQEGYCEVINAGMKCVLSPIEKTLLKQKHGEYLLRVEGVSADGVDGPPGSAMAKPDDEVAENMKAFIQAYKGQGEIVMMNEDKRKERISEIERDLEQGDAPLSMWVDYQEFVHTFGDVSAIRSADKRMASEKRCIHMSSGLSDGVERKPKRSREDSDVDANGTAKQARVEASEPAAAGV